MRKTILFVLACISMYFFAFFIPMVIEELYAIATAGTLAVVAQFSREKAIAIALQRLAPTFIVVGLRGLKKVVTRIISEHFMHAVAIRYPYIRDTYIGIHLNSIFVFDRLKKIPRQEKIYIGTIFLPIAAVLFIYFIVRKTLRGIVIKKIVTTSTVKLLDKVIPKVVSDTNSKLRALP